jgi:probable addiction module antidote protein
MATKDYLEGLDKRLADRRYAVAYLDACLREGDARGMLVALGDVARVHGSVSALAEKAALNRPSLYRMLSEQGNPTIESLSKILQVLGLRLAITEQDDAPAL